MTSIVRFSRCNRKKRKQAQETLCCTNAGCYRKENSCPGLHCGPLIIAKTLHTVLFAQPSRKAKQTEGSETLKGTMVPPSPAPLTQRQVRVNGQWSTDTPRAARPFSKTLLPPQLRIGCPSAKSKPDPSSRTPRYETKRSPRASPANRAHRAHHGTVRARSCRAIGGPRSWRSVRSV